MNRSSRLGTAALIASGLVWTTVAPAIANDLHLAIDSKYHGDWDDLVDTLCARMEPPGGDPVAEVRVHIAPVDGTGPSFLIADTTSGNGPNCTANLSIPEDELYRMTVIAAKFDGTTWKSKTGTFYT